MANFGQMLAAAQAYATPEQERMKAQSQSQAAEYEVKKEKKSQMDELQALMEAEMKKASEKKGIFGGWAGNIGKLLSFIPAIGTGVGAGLQALEGVGQASEQKSALKNLMKDSRFDKYKGTYLGDPTKQYLKDVEGLAGDIDPLKTGLTSLASSWASGNIAKGIGGKFKDAFKGSPMVGPLEEGVMSRPFEGGIGEGGLKSLFKDFDLMDILGEAGGEKGMENLQALPYLLQLFGGGSGQEMDFDAQSYFQ